MPSYMIYLADWDKLRALNDDRQTLWDVTTKGKTLDDRSLYMEPYKLEASSIKEAYEILNIRHPDQWRNEQRRSLSVGDVVVDESGEAWVCRSVGWKRVRDWEPKSLVNELAFNNPIPAAKVGMPATVCFHSDRVPATVIEVSGEGKRIKVQEDKAERMDSNGMSDCQDWSFSRDPNGRIFDASFRKKVGRYVVKGEDQKSGTRVHVGSRGKFYDYSF